VPNGYRDDGTAPDTKQGGHGSTDSFDHDGSGLAQWMAMIGAQANEDDLGLVVRGHLLLESILRAMLETGFLYPINADAYSRGLTLTLRAELCVALGMIDGTWLAPIRNVNRIRNAFAHRPLHEVREVDVDALISSMPRIGKDVFDALEAAGPHTRLGNIFFAMLVVFNASISILKSYAAQAGPRGASRNPPRPPHDVYLRAVINIRNEGWFQIPSGVKEARRTKTVRNKKLVRSGH
jgi:hypothetical protein